MNPTTDTKKVRTRVCFPLRGSSLFSVLAFVPVLSSQCAVHRGLGSVDTCVTLFDPAVPLRVVFFIWTRVSTRVLPISSFQRRMCAATRQRPRKAVLLVLTTVTGTLIEDCKIESNRPTHDSTTFRIQYSRLVSLISCSLWNALPRRQCGRQT